MYIRNFVVSLICICKPYSYPELNPKKMKKAVPALTFLFIGALFMAFESSTGSPMRLNGAPAGYSGDPAGGNKTCKASGCHSGPTPAFQAGWIASDVPVAGYLPGNTYTVTATATRAGHMRFGFQVSPQNSSGTFSGTLVNTGSQTQLTGTSNSYITHTASGTSGTGLKTWTFNWTAPASGSGTVTFYGAFNVTNANNFSTGDTIYTSTLIIPENTSAWVTNLFSGGKILSVCPNPVTDHVNIKFAIAEPSLVEIRIIDMRGKVVRSLLSESFSTGTFLRSFNLLDQPLSGIYLLKLSVGNNSSICKIVFR
jgi:hypothetical protein